MTDREASFDDCQWCSVYETHLAAAVRDYDTLRDLASSVSLDHSCSVEGWDDECPECRLAKYLYEKRGNDD